MNWSRKKILYAVLIITVLIVGLIVYYNFNPTESFFFPKCPFLLLTGLKCPGCGSQRAIHALLHLDFFAAFRYNALLIISIPYIILLLITKFFSAYLALDNNRRKSTKIDEEQQISPASSVSPSSPAGRSVLATSSSSVMLNTVKHLTFTSLSHFPAKLQHPTIIRSYFFIVIIFWITRNIYHF